VRSTPLAEQREIRQLRGVVIWGGERLTSAARAPLQPLQNSRTSFQKLKRPYRVCLGKFTLVKASFLFFSSTPLYRTPLRHGLTGLLGIGLELNKLDRAYPPPPVRGCINTCVGGSREESLAVLLRSFFNTLVVDLPEPCALSRFDCRFGESGVGPLYHTILTPMDRSLDCMDLDVGDDRRETTWWEDLTKDSVRMQELVGKLNPACFPIDQTRPCREVDMALERVYYGLHPSHARGTHILDFRTACAHIIPVINNISRQNHRNAGGSAGGMGAFTSTMSSFLHEDYPESAPFNSEALHSRTDDGAGDGGSVSSSHGGAGSPRSGVPLSLRERPKTGDRSHPCDSQPHPHPPYGNPATPTLSDSTKRSPGRSNSGSPRPSGGTDSCLSADENIRSYPFSPALASPRRSRANSHSRSVLNLGQPPIHTGHHFVVPPPRFSNGTGPGGQHKCDVCGKVFPYLSKLK